MSNTTTKHVSWEEYFSQEHKDYVDEHNLEYWLICETCGEIVNGCYRDDPDQCVECHDKRYENNHLEWCFKTFFDNDLSDEERESMKDWTYEDFNKKCAWPPSDDYSYTEFDDCPRDDDPDGELYDYICKKEYELAKQGIRIDWR